MNYRRDEYVRRQRRITIKAPRTSQAKPPATNDLERAARGVEKDLLGWLGLLPDSEAPNTEPNYQERLRALGAHLARKNITAQECLLSLALHYLSSTENHPLRRQFIGRARQLFQGARSLEAIANSAEEVGRDLEAEATKRREDAEALLGAAEAQ